MFAGLSPVSPTPIPFVPPRPTQAATTSSTSTTTRKPVLEELRSQSAIEHQIPIIIEEQFSPMEEGAKQHLFVFAKDGRFKDDSSNDVFANDVFKQPNKKENFIADPTVVNPPVLETTETSKPVTPNFDPRKRQRLTDRPRVNSGLEKDSLLDSSLDLTKRLKELKETIRKTKESLTAQKSLLASRRPTSKPRRKKVRVRGRKRVRVPVSRRPAVSKESLRLRRPEKEKEKEDEKNSTTINILIEETPRSSGRVKGRGRQKIEIKTNQNNIVKEENSRKEKAKDEAALESELEEKYGESVVQVKIFH